MKKFLTSLISAALVAMPLALVSAPAAAKSPVEMKNAQTFSAAKGKKSKGKSKSKSKSTADKAKK
jgi:Ni/Co efflux regulator RcnB